ncbi:MAG: DUF1330 domain-containing protein [Pseudomonadota bacterium]
MTPQDFVDWYGNGSDGSSPTLQQWERIFGLPDDTAVTLVNFFKLNSDAVYPSDFTGMVTDVSGQEAFGRYASVSIPTLEKVGGHFLHVGPFAGQFIGEEEEWDVIAIGKYPHRQSLIDLYSDEGYRDVFVHRTAACARQKVLMATA